jgi:hypothetical protein
MRLKRVEGVREGRQTVSLRKVLLSRRLVTGSISLISMHREPGIVSPSLKTRHRLTVHLPATSGVSARGRPASTGRRPSFDPYIAVRDADIQSRAKRVKE